MPFFLYDIAVLLILAFFIWRGASRGFILTFLGMLALLVAFVGANFLAGALAPKVGAAVEPKFAAVIEERLNEQFQAADAPALPDGETSGGSLTGVLGLLKSMGLYEELVDAVEQAVQAGMAEVAAAAAAAVAASIAQSVAYMVLFLLFFVLILLLWTLLSHALDLVSKLPGLNAINRTSGALVGLIKGGLILFLAAWFLRTTGNLIPPETVEQTTLLRFFMTANPVSVLTGI
jgi:uncharacterized membrane protein required for colicin V production